jgi:hypothetical protein
MSGLIANALFAGSKVDRGAEEFLEFPTEEDEEEEEEEEEGEEREVACTEVNAFPSM